MSLEVGKTIIAAEFDSMTYGELELFESIVGAVPGTEEELAKVPRSSLMLALGLIAAKRDDPAVTLDDLRGLPIGSIEFVDSEDPT